MHSLSFLGLLFWNSALAEVIEVNPGDDLFAALENLQPGDSVIVSEGTYSTQSSSGSWYQDVTLNGTEESPIIVRAAEGESVVIEGDPEGSQNIVNIQGEHYTWAGFEMVYGSHGLRVGSTAHATFEDLHIHHTGDVGFSCNRPGGTYQDLTIRGNEIHDTRGTGECFYLGCNEDGCQMWDSLVEFNYCHDTLETSQGDGIELKTGSYDVTIRHNVIHDVKYPAITTYGTLDRGVITVEGNVIWNTQDNGIQVVGDAEVRNNLVMNAAQSGILSKSSQGEIPENLRILHNTVVNGTETCLRGNDWDEAGVSDIVVANNVLLCDGGQALRLPNGKGGAVISSNAVLGDTDDEEGTFPVSPGELGDLGSGDLYPAVDSALINAGDNEHSVDMDHNCLPRDDGQVDIGAYEWGQKTNPGGPVEAGPKSCVEFSGSDTGGDTGGETEEDTGHSEPGSADCGCVNARGRPGSWIFWAPLLALFGGRRPVQENGDPPLENGRPQAPTGSR